MPSIQLDPVEARILGCLLEKERLTPENYPLSLNSLATACNQSTNRDPVVGFDEKTVEAGLYALREKKLASLIHAAGARVQKYRHNLPDLYQLDPAETSVLCVLLLRGPQTPGELRIRTERLHGFPSIEEVERTLEELARGDEPLVKVLPPRPGQKERRYVQLLSIEQPSFAVESSFVSSAPQVIPPQPSRMEAMEKELDAVKQDLSQLREEFAAFRKQFE
jgi:uncharacterized protein YceH (UPF0502 family)